MPSPIHCFSLPGRFGTELPLCGRSPPRGVVVKRGELGVCSDEQRARCPRNKAQDIGPPWRMSRARPRPRSLCAASAHREGKRCCRYHLDHRVRPRFVAVIVGHCCSSHPGASTGGLAGSDVLRRPASEDLLGSSKRKKSTCSVKPICPRSPARLHRLVKPQPSPGKNGARKPGLQSRTRKPGP